MYRPESATISAPLSITKLSVISTAQTLRRSVTTATAHAQVPVVVAARMTGHSPAVYSAHYARAFRDAEQREKGAEVACRDRVRTRAS